MKRPITTLFMLMSLDGKISTGETDNLDFDQDFPNIPGIKEGLHQYYEIEETTDLWSINTGRVQAKIGVNQKEVPDHHWAVSFVLLDNNHLEAQGVRYFCGLSKRLVIVTSNKNHPAYQIKADNLSILYYDKLDLNTMLEDLKNKFGVERATIQTGGTLNSLFVRAALVDYLDIVVAPAIVGGAKTATLVDGKSLTELTELNQIKALKLIEAKPLENSYLRLKYQVI